MTGMTMYFDDFIKVNTRPNGWEDVEYLRVVIDTQPGDPDGWHVNSGGRAVINVTNFPNLRHLDIDSRVVLAAPPVVYHVSNIRIMEVNNLHCYVEPYLFPPTVETLIINNDMQMVTPTYKPSDHASEIINHLPNLKNVFFTSVTTLKALRPFKGHIEKFGLVGLNGIFSATYGHTNVAAGELVTQNNNKRHEKDHNTVDTVLQNMIVGTSNIIPWEQRKVTYFDSREKTYQRELATAQRFYEGLKETFPNAAIDFVSDTALPEGFPTYLPFPTGMYFYPESMTDLYWNLGYEFKKSEAALKDVRDRWEDVLFEGTDQ